jgi:uncharacterized protein with von Willebrand factor type A (vWA) domain
MTSKTNTEFIRLTQNEPLTLACSALADFLWEDFVREAKPSVRYLIETYNVKQLSRFGKELFERLYKADDVNWLVSLEAYEEYFRKVCDGDKTALPEGYKPENGFWYAVMEDLSRAAAWPQLLHHCSGEQYNSANNAVLLLNKLSEEIEKAIEEQTINIEMLAHAGQKLEELRKQFSEAQARGDKAEAERLRKEGKQLNQDLHDAIEQAKQVIQGSANKIVDSTLAESQETNEALSTVYGTSAGTKQRTLDIEKKKELAQRLSNNTKLRQIIKKLGSLQRIWQERKRAKRFKSDYEAITGAEFSNNIIKAFPSEMALAATPQGRALFALKYSQKTLLTKDYTAHRKDLGKGPIIMYIDASGSMSGELEIWSKAIALVIAEQATKENRRLYVNLFDTAVVELFDAAPGQVNKMDILEELTGWTLGGGTSFNAVINHAVAKGPKEPKADIIILTDGHADVGENFVKSINNFKNNTGTQVSTVCLNMAVPDVCKLFSDETFSVDISKSVDTVDAIQKCIR